MRFNVFEGKIGGKLSFAELKEYYAKNISVREAILQRGDFTFASESIISLIVL